MKVILTYLLFSLVIPICLTVMFYTHFRYDEEDIDANMRYLLQPSKEQNEILFIGNSRTHRLIDPRITEERTGMKAYNLGLEGANTVYFNMVYRIYLHRHARPKYLVINVDYRRCFNMEQVYNFPDYFPYLKDSMVAAYLAPYYDDYQNSATQFYYRIKRINSKPDPSKVMDMEELITHSEEPVSISSDSLRGFHPINLTWASQSHSIEVFDAIYSAKGIQLLRQMIEDARSRGIKVIMVCAPFYKDYHRVVRNYSVIQDAIIHISNDTHTPYWNYSDVGMSMNTAYFYNINHLNAKGASLYSEMLADDLKRYLADSTFIPDMGARNVKSGPF